MIWRDAEWRRLYGNKWETIRGFVLDLSYYESFNDEPGDRAEMESPRHLCTDNAEDIQEIW